MTWTTRTPTQPGLYFYRYSPKHIRQVVEVVRNGCGCLYVELTPLVDYDKDGQWSSEPIKEPDNEL